MGVAILGDSAGAHFSLPVDWMRPYNWTVDSKPFSDWKIAVGNELDWPMMSAFTGFTDKCWSNAPNSFIQAGIHGPKPIGPRPSGAVLVLGPDQE